MNNNWGFNRAGNKLEGDGSISAEGVERLDGLARWMKGHGEAIHGTQSSPFEGLSFRVTRRARRLNCFLPQWPTAREGLLRGLRTMPQRARLLGDPQRQRLGVCLVKTGGVGARNAPAQVQAIAAYVWTLAHK